MTTRPTVTLPQLYALEAAANGTLTRSDHSDAPWTISAGAHVTASARVLLERGLIAEGYPRNPDGRVPALLTPAGSDLLADLASRSPDGTA